MVRIDLGVEGYFIEVDDLNATLKQTYSGVRNGLKKKCEKVVGYYGNVPACLKVVLERLPNDYNDGKSVGLQEYLDSLEKARKAIFDALRKMGYR